MDVLKPETKQSAEPKQTKEGETKPVDTHRENRKQKMPTAIEKQTDSQALDQVSSTVDERAELSGLNAGTTLPAKEAPASAPELIEAASSFVRGDSTPTAPVRNNEEETAKAPSSLSSALRLLQAAEIAGSPKALRLLADLAEAISTPTSSARGDGEEAVNAPSPSPKPLQDSQSEPVVKASHIIQPSGGGLPTPDLRAEYEKRVASLRLGDVAGLMEVKREFRKRGLDVEKDEG